MSYFCVMKVFLFSVNILLHTLLSAQLQPIYNSFTITNGLSNNTIYSFFQYPNGKILVGVDDGINSFNGIKFKKLYTESETRAIHNFVLLDEDKVLCKNFQNKSFIIFNDTIQLLDSVYWNCKFISNDSLIYGVGKNYLLQIHKNLTYERFDLPINLDQLILNAEILNDIIYCWIYDKNKNSSILNFSVKNNKVDFSYDITEKVYLDFFVFEKNLFVIDLLQNNFYRYSDYFNLQSPIIQFEASERITSACILKSGEWLFGTYNGVILFNQKFEFKARYFEGQVVSKCMQDIEGNIWLGTLNDGILILPNINNLEYNVENNLGKHTKISNAIFTDEKIIFGTFDGKIRAINTSGKLLWKTEFNKDIEIQAMHVDTTKNQLIAYANELNSIDLNTGKIVNQFNVTSTKSIAINNTTIACGTSYGIATSVDDFKHHHNELWVNNVYFFNDTTLIIETQLGIKLFNINTSHISDVLTNKSEYTNLVKWNDLFIVLSNDSLYQLDINKITTFKWQPKNNLKLGVSGSRLYSIAINGDVRFWNGFSQFEIHHYDGFKNDFPLKVIETKDNILLISKNAIRFIVADYSPIKVKPIIYIEQISGSFVKKNAIYQSDFNSNRIGFLISLLPNIRGNGEGKIYYRVKGIQDNWKETAKDEFYYSVDLERLPAGNHLIEFYGVNADGEFTDTVSFSLYVFSPFYLKWWFILGCVLICGIIIYRSIKWRINKTYQKNIDRIEKEKLKIKVLNAELLAIRSQMNPHLIFNSLSAIQTKVISNQNKEAYEHLVIFSKLLRKALDFSRTEFISLTDELDFIRNYIELEFLRKNDKGLIYTININDNLNPDNFIFPALLLQPIVENAILHGLMHSDNPIKKLTIDIRPNKNGYIIIIEDNGVGRKKSGIINSNRDINHKSFATKAINERCEIINKANKINISINTIDLVQGTQVEIFVYNKN